MTYSADQRGQDGKHKWISESNVGQPCHTNSLNYIPFVLHGYRTQIRKTIELNHVFCCLHSLHQLY